MDVTLADVSEIGAGNSAPQDKRLFQAGTYPFIRTSDVGRVRFGSISTSADLLNDEGIKGLRLVPRGTILMPKSGASTFLNHRVEMAEDGYVSSHLATVYAREKVCDGRFLLYFLSTIKAQDLIQDHKYPSLTLRTIGEIPVSLPPLDEQKRIVAVLDQAFAAIDRALANAEANLADAEVLALCLKEDLIERFVGDVSMSKLGDCCAFVRGPFGGSLKKSIFKKSGFAVYEQQHAIHRRFENFRYFVDQKKFDEMARFLVRPGEVIMSCSGTMGRVAVVPNNAPVGIINQALLKLSPSKELLPEFLKRWMESAGFQAQLAANKLGVAIENVASVKTLKLLEIPLLPLDGQAKVVEVMDDIDQKRAEVRRCYELKLLDIAALRQSLLQAAFSGQLT